MEFRNLSNNYPDSISYFSKVSLMIMLLLITGTSYGNQNGHIKPDILKSTYQSLIGEIYQSLRSDESSNVTIHKNISNINYQFNKFLKSGNELKAIELIRNNFELITDHYDSEITVHALDLLYKYNLISPAKTIHGQINNYGDKPLISAANFSTSIYHYLSGDWDKVLTLLENRYDDLAESEYSYAHFISGVSYQYKKEHKNAINHFSLIKETSKYYYPAQLNMAISLIKIDWWSDAYDIVLKLEKLNKQSNNAYLERLYTIIGYTFINKDMHRDARNIFKKVTLGSEYTNRALVGLAISAINQKDYIGALNAVNTIKDSNYHDLSFHEAYILSPYIFYLLKKTLTAESDYKNSFEYYDAVIDKMTRFKKRLDPKIESNANIHSLASFNVYDEAFLVNDNIIIDLNRILNQLDYLKINHTNASGTLLNKINKLYNNIQDYIHDYKIDQIEKRIYIIREYKNQIRLGLASIYDSITSE